MSEKQGYANFALVEPVPQRYNTEAETVYSGKNNTFIVLGRDRPSTPLSGYGGVGEPACGTIYLVAGLGGADIKEKEGEGAEASPYYYNSSFRLDASRIYISQKTDVDSNFSVAAGSTGISGYRSAIALKADDIRIIGRESIKIVTRTDVRNSQGVGIPVIGGIDLIAGNDDSDLQPLVKGHNLNEAVVDLIDKIKQLNGIVAAFLDLQSKFNEKISAHTHLMPLLGQSPSTWFTGDGFYDKSIPMSLVGEQTIMDLMTKVMMSLETNNKNFDIFKVNYLNPAARKYINSKYNNTN